jgi:hypothetical protein
MAPTIIDHLSHDINLVRAKKKVCFQFRKTKPVITKVKRRVITCVVGAANILILKPNNFKLNFNFKQF